VLPDVQFRIGGATVVKATTSLVITSSNVITDDSSTTPQRRLGRAGTPGFRSGQLPVTR
jgi:hypothetical protein